MSLRWRGYLLEIVETLVLTLLIYFLMVQFVMQPFEIRQQSMEKTLYQGQLVFVDKLSPHWSDYKRGDIIVFNPPAGYEEGGSDEPFIKRVIATAGQTVEVKNGHVYVDGVALDEPYVYDGQDTYQTGPESKWYVPQGELFVMGDHRQASRDSREFGPIAKSTVVGRALIRYWPLDKFGFIPSSQPAAQPAAP